MQSTSQTDVHVDWSCYHHMIEQLALQIYESGWTFDVVLCLARGGLSVGNVLCRIFDKPLAVIFASSYRDAAGTEQGELHLGQFIAMTGHELSGRVLLVDDLVDTGVTLAAVKDYLARYYPTLVDVRSAVLWCKAAAMQKPDYCVDSMEHNPWIHQPFEAYDALRPHMLSAWLKKD